MTRSIGRWPFAATLLVVPCLVLACSDSGGGAERPTPARPAAKPAEAPAPMATAAPPAASRPAPTAEQLYERGRSVYMGNCTACHNMDPAQPGGLGPAIAGASRELIEARVLHATYPEGYTPKRDTKLMVALPHLKDDIDALAAYLRASS